VRWFGSPVSCQNVDMYVVYCCRLPTVVFVLGGVCTVVRCTTKYNRRMQEESKDPVYTTLYVGIIVCKKNCTVFARAEKKLFAQCNSEIEPSCCRLMP
jgi:hypothetical protein